MMCKEGEVPKISAAAGINIYCSYAVHEVYKRRNCDGNTDSRNRYSLYEIHNIGFRLRLKYPNSTGTPNKSFKVSNTKIHSTGQYACVAASEQTYMFCFPL
jgi:hypothetical protein